MIKRGGNDMKRHFVLGSVIFLAIVLCSISSSFAYTLSGTIYGGGNPLPNATVTVSDAVTSTQLATTVTNASGVYSFSVSNGTYNLLVTPPSGSGFGTS
ncbi:MAG TPA: carboxypeptidase-like regulatory domain-containing protein, partial [Thermodesulfovibrionales bacterium]|nr:carboxypeptidase-like regulatory domain-containing protein [Thermodesulfovibrionales bacterium]